MATCRSVSAVFTAFIFCWTLCQGSEGGNNSLLTRGALDAVVDPETIWTDMGHDMDISCKLPQKDTYTDRRLEACEFWVFPHNKGEKAVNYCVAYRKDGPEVCSYTCEVDKAALVEGECRLRVKNVEENAFGMWNCTLTSVNYGTFAGATAVRKWVKPEGFMPVIENHEGIVVDPNDTKGDVNNVSCCVTVMDAEPRPELYFQITGQDGSVLKRVIQNYSDKDQDSDKSELCAVWSEQFDYRWNGKNLECGLDHVAFTEQDRNKYKTSVKLDILYDPIVVAKTLVASTKNNAVFVEAKIMGNPRPRVKWQVHGAQYNNESESDRIKVETEDLGIDMVKSNLTLTSNDIDLSGVTVYLQLWVNEDHAPFMQVPFEIRYQEGLDAAADNLHVVLFVTLGLLTVITIVTLVILRIRQKKTESLPVTTQDAAEDPVSGVQAGAGSVSLTGLRRHRTARQTAVELPRVPEELQPAISAEGEAAEEAAKITTTPV